MEMAGGVVNDLELIQIDEQQRGTGQVLACQQALQTGLEFAALSSPVRAS